ncbi:DNA replication licensing factor mcm8 [Linnemannia gamsii]|uniref:Minichromosome maintenance 8 n=1 Tax=Linnemannia gamsii TaxID=64522 RepID=A0ABQ7JUC6_9FUNG|nr:DNA replication licensing factor mcm8 [Linnemannia gamsii]
MPPEQSNSRGSYARRGGGYSRGGGRSPWRGRSKSNGNGNNNNSNSNDEDDFEVGGARNNQYPGHLQNSGAQNNNKNGKRWERPRTSTQRNSDGGLQFEQDDANLPMVQADEIPTQARQAAPPRTKKRVANCPWIDWDVYLPFDDYHEQHEYIQWITEFRQYIQRYHLQSKKLRMELERQRVCVVNLKTLVHECDIPSLMDLVVHRTTAVLGCISLAAIQARHSSECCWIQELDEDKNALFGEEVAKEKHQKMIMVRIGNLDKITHGKDLKANLIGKLICVRGTIVRTSGVRPLATKMSFTCNACQGVQTLEFPDARYIQPTRCPEVGCKGRHFTPQRGVGYDTETVDWQTIRLQEKLPDDRMDSGRVPRTIDCEVTRDLVDRVIPGDVVEFTGIVKVSQSEKSYSREKTGNTMYLLYLDVNYLEKSTMTKMDDEDDDMYNDEDSKDRTKESKDNIQITMKDLYAIEDVHNEPQLFKLIVNSFSPAIFGLEMVKAGILFGLFGGRRRSSAVVDRTAIRPDPHILVVGDPGLGKSQMLSAAVKVAPRGVYVCGSSGISTSGLTVTLVRGAGSDFALEAGALVLGDQGCCCIDEFDKMTTDHNALLEAMEQQSISIAKAGIICTLPARTSVIAAANPVGGHYNTSKTVAENLKMNTALLSRFDLIFILMDKPDGEMDQYLSRHVMALHSGNPTAAPTFRGSALQESDPSQASGVKPEMNRPLEERLRMTSEDNMELIPLPLLRKYIAYARQYVHPRLSREAAATLQEFYLMLRTKYRSPDGTPVTTRQLESMIRMAEARARMELREAVTRRDAMDVIEIMTYSLRDAFGPTDGHPSSQGQSQSGHGKGASMKRYVAELQRIAFENSSNMFTQDQLYNTFQGMQLRGITGGFMAFLDTLNHQNFLLKKGPRTYQLSVVM